MLQYYLTENLLTANQDDYMAHTTNVRSYSSSELAELILKRGTTLSKADILAVLEVYHEVAIDTLADGCSINTPLFHASPSISGVFNGAGDSFDSNRHSIHINMNAGTDLRDAIRKIRVEKVQTAEAIPHLVEIKDTVSNTVNENLTSGGVIEITGSMLKVNTQNEKNGIFIINVDTEDTKKVSVIVENKPSRLIAMLPVLDHGGYTVEVRTTLSTGKKELKTLRVGRFPKNLTV